MTDPLFIVIDLFCGAGGTTTGFDHAVLPQRILSSYYVGPNFQEDGFQKIAEVIACVNHDPKAIESHWLNHKNVKHFNEDIRTLDLTDLIDLVERYRRLYPSAFIILWASLECTNFSKAKGGQPRDADSRTLADHLDRYVVALNPDYIQIENVVEFMSWGPLDDKGKPISRRNGEDWLRWRESICQLGYWNDWKELNSADFGAYTSRNRLFGVFAKHGLPITWPHPTHGKVNKKKKASKLFNSDLAPWKPVKDVLDFTDEGESIFTRAKPLSDKTLERIYAGLVKYVAKGDTSFISKYYSGKPAGKVDSVNCPSATVTTFGNQSLVQTVGFTAQSVDQPAGTVTTVDHHSLVKAHFLSHYYGVSGHYSSVEQPAPTITTKDRSAVVSAEYFIDKHYGSNAQNQSIEQPAGTIVTNDKHRLVQCESFLMPTNFDNKPVGIDQPSPTITANRKHHYLVNPSHGGHCTGTDQPCPVIIARQDKAPLYLVQAEQGSVAIAIYDTDSPIMIRIKEFMAVYGIVDIKMRMLRVHELLKIQGFPADYQLIGNQADQKKFIGNSVVPQVVKAWTEAMAIKIIDHQNRKVA